MSNIKAARALGWTSLAVGLTEIVATQWLEDTMGVDDHHTLIRSFGVREIAAGATILSQPGLTATLVAGLWSRVAGDAADLAVIGLAVPTTRNHRGLMAIAGIVLAVTGMDLMVASRAQYDLIHGKKVSKAARMRVTPTQAIPKAALSDHRVAQPVS